MITNMLPVVAVILISQARGSETVTKELTANLRMANPQAVRPGVTMTQSRRDI